MPVFLIAFFLFSFFSQPLKAADCYVYEHDPVKNIQVRKLDPNCNIEDRIAKEKEAESSDKPWPVITDRPDRNFDKSINWIDRIYPQDAGRTLFINDEVAIHERANHYPTSPYNSGPPVCQRTETRSGGAAYASFLTVIANKNKEFLFTRKWLWDTVRPIVQDSVLPKYCPNSKQAMIVLHINGYDVNIKGEEYDITETEMPRMLIPHNYTKEDMHPSDDNLIRSRVSFYWDVRNFISEGIVNFWLAGPGATADTCNKEYDYFNCEFETFSPNYNGEFTPSYLRDIQTNSGIGRGKTPAQKREIYLKNAEEFDRRANFINFVDRRKKEYIIREEVRKQREERAKRVAQFNAAIEKFFSENSAEEIFLQMMFHGHNASPCRDPNSRAMDRTDCHPVLQ